MAGQMLHGLVLAMAVLAAASSAGFMARRRFFSLLRRTRILLLSIALLFACGTPGMAWWPELGVLAPTREGVALALEHGARLIWVLAWLAWLLEFTPPDDLVAGVYGLLKPFAAARLRQKAALRLLLVLQYVEAERQTAPGPRRPWLDGLNWLDRDEPEATRLRLELRPLAAADALVLFLLMLTTLGLWLWSAA